MKRPFITPFSHLCHDSAFFLTSPPLSERAACFSGEASRAGGVGFGGSGWSERNSKVATPPPEALSLNVAFVIVAWFSVDSAPSGVAIGGSRGAPGPEPEPGDSATKVGGGGAPASPPPSGFTWFERLIAFFMAPPA
eukprot:COSAG04_NODE_337_length_16405_cov_652.804060_16_plen_137_part_00